MQITNIINKIPEAFNPDSPLKATIVVKIEGEGGENFTIKTEQGSCIVDNIISDKPDAIVIMNITAFSFIVAEQMSLAEAIGDGHAQVSYGDSGVASDLFENIDMTILQVTEDEEDEKE